MGTGEDLTIQELAESVRDVVYPEARLKWNTEMPEGAPRKLLDGSKIQELGWRHSIELKDGLRSAYQWFLNHVAEPAA